MVVENPAVYPPKAGTDAWLGFVTRSRVASIPNGQVRSNRKIPFRSIASLQKRRFLHLSTPGTILTGGLDLICYLMAPMALKDKHEPPCTGTFSALNHDGLRFFSPITTQG